MENKTTVYWPIYSLFLVISFYHLTFSQGNTVVPVCYEIANRDTPASENFKIMATNLNLIAQADSQLNLPFAQRNKIVIGSLAMGNGGFNDPWHWHIPMDKWELGDGAIEVCDGRASDLENDLNYWVNTVKSYCPWGSVVLKKCQVTSIGKVGEENRLTRPPPKVRFDGKHQFLSFQLHTAGVVKVELFELNGRSKLLSHGYMNPGQYEILLPEQHSNLLYLNFKFEGAALARVLLPMQ